jgi:hypothetical protein
MAKPLLNYTTQVPVDRTVAEITRILVGQGASAVQTEYAACLATAVAFTLGSPRGADTYRIPARADRVLVLLERQKEAGMIAPRFATKDQAARVAWRIVKDWLEAQFAIVAANMADYDEVLLPYQLRNGRTFYDWYVDARPSLPGPGGDFAPPVG